MESEDRNQGHQSPLPARFCRRTDIDPELILASDNVGDLASVSFTETENDHRVQSFKDSISRTQATHKSRRGVEGAGQRVCQRPRQQLVKKTCEQRETLTITGFALEEGKWDGMYLGRRRKSQYAGKVDHRFDKASAADLQKRLKPLIRKTQPYSKRIANKGIWVEPKLLAEIEYRAKSAEGKVRHPFFKGLREDL